METAQPALFDPKQARQSLIAALAIIIIISMISYVQNNTVEIMNVSWVEVTPSENGYYFLDPTGKSVAAYYADIGDNPLLRQNYEGDMEACVITIMKKGKTIYTVKDKSDSGECK